MINTLSKPRPIRFAVYCRVATKAQLTHKHSQSQHEEVPKPIKVLNKPYVLPEKLVMPIYDYRSRINVVFKLKNTTSQSNPRS